ncbi:hypothetical protein E4U14_004075 [Claviceps sp. LM454 group G7]|nr:hypothetical protein E4U14_004075 [Claviceps sp. LM454 group G7]
MKPRPPDGGLLLMKRNTPHDEDSADVEESDGSIDDQRGREREILREGIPLTVYTFSSDQETLLDAACYEAFEERHDTGELFVYGLRKLPPTGGKTGPMRGFLLCVRLCDRDGGRDM